MYYNTNVTSEKLSMISFRTRSSLSSLTVLDTVETEKQRVGEASHTMIESILSGRDVACQLVRELRILVPSSIIALFGQGENGAAMRLKAMDARPEFIPSLCNWWPLNSTPFSLDPSALSGLEARPPCVLSLSDLAAKTSGAQSSFIAALRSAGLSSYIAIGLYDGAELRGAVVFVLSEEDPLPENGVFLSASRLASAALASVHRERQFEASLVNKQLMFKEIHHRIKNNLQMLVSLLRLQSDRSDIAAVRNSLGVAADRVHSMAIIHNLLHESVNENHIDAAQYIRLIADNIIHVSHHANGQLDIRYMLDSVPLSTDKAIPLGLIVNELITNAVKYGGRDDQAPSISISLQNDGTSISLTVSDNGDSLPKDFNPEQSNTLGMLLVLSLSSQLGGALRVESGGATRFHVHFPV